MKKKVVQNRKDGYHLNSKYWQDYKKSLSSPELFLIEIAIGMVLRDACVRKTSTQAHIKFEQGYKQKNFLFHIFDIFKKYCFMEKPGVRIEPKSSLRAGSVKSYWFRTFSHTSFTQIWNLFYIDVQRNKSEARRKKVVAT